MQKPCMADRNQSQYTNNEFVERCSEQSEEMSKKNIYGEYSETFDNNPIK